MNEQYYDIERRTAIKEDARMFRRKFITYDQAEVIYSISHRKMRDLAEAAGAIYRFNDVSKTCPNVTDLNCLISYEFFQERKMLYKWRKRTKIIKNLQI